MKIFNQKLAIDCAIARIFVLSLFVVFSTNGRADTPSTTVVTLNGTAQGGVVSIMELLPIDAGFASVVTTQGESVEAVLNRLAEEVCRSSVFNWRRPLQPRPEFVKVTGNTVTLPLSGLRYCFSGTDKGFVSLKPVLSVSGSYDAEKHQISMSWINPPETYDEIKVGSLTFPPSTTNCTYDCDPKKRKHMSFGLVTGKRGDDTSPPASIIINEDSQEELDTFPFYMGLAPNWSYWSDSNNAAAVICEQGIKTATEADAGVRGDPWDKPLYQSIRTDQGGVQGGVWRRFLGLKPGHTYKVETRLNTRQMDTCTNAWAFSFHAACDNPDGGGLTVAQMAGQAALPDGSSGSKAGRVALYEPGTTTKGQWKKRSTDVPGSGLEIKNLTLPKDVTSITVWLRCSGANSTGVGMDWIKLTDVTDKH